jgi:uncharacterized OsmC-like protein
MVTPISTVLDGARALLGQHPELGRTATVVRAVLGEATTVEVVAGRRRFVVDEPERAGGHDAGPNPVDLALAALGSCTAITYRYWSELLGVPLDALEIEVRADGDVRALIGMADDVSPAPDLAMSVRVSGPATVGEYARLHAAVESHCPVLALLRGGAGVRTTLQVGSSPVG